MPDYEFDPYHKWLGIPPEQQPPNHYRLLGVELFESDADVIESAAVRQMAHIRSFAIGQHGQHSQQLLNEIAEAKLTLLSQERKCAYDETLQELRRTVEPVHAVQCPTCYSALAVNKSLYGKLVKCPKCNANCRISADGNEANGITVSNESKEVSPFDGLPQPIRQPFVGKSSAIAIRNRKARKVSHRQRLFSNWIAVVTVSTGLICFFALTMFLIWFALKKEPSEAVTTDNSPTQPASGVLTTSSGASQDAASEVSQQNAPKNWWIHESLIAQFDLDNAVVRNLASGRVGHWRDGDRAKGRWVKSFTGIPTHKAVPDRFGNPTGAVSGLFGLDRSYSLKTFTIAVWFRWTANHPTDQYQVLIGKCAKSTLHTCNYMLCVTNQQSEGESGALRGVVSGGAEKETVLFSTQKPVTDQKWHHAALVCDYKLSEVSLYLDGEQVDRKKLIGGVDTSEKNAFAGYWRGYNWCYGIFTGNLDDLRVYDKALTKEHIAELYAYESKAAPAPMPALTPLLTIEHSQMHQQAWADYLNIPVESINSIGMKFKVIPPGLFKMGNSENAEAGERTETLHNVTLTRPFQIGIHEVTQEQYEKVMGKTPSKFIGAQNPAEHVSWNDATEFCRKLTAIQEETGSGYRYRLPTEAEWEYACRGGTGTAYNFGASDDELRDHAWFASNSESTPHTVGTKKPNRWGLYDMHGNVSEWCRDRDGDYPRHPVFDPSGPSSGPGRISRGGSSFSKSEQCCSNSRSAYAEDFRDQTTGFRVVRMRIK